MIFKEVNKIFTLAAKYNIAASSPPTGLSSVILSYDLLIVSWSPVLDAKG